MERIIFATDKDMKEYIDSHYPYATTEYISDVTDRYEHDDSMRYIGDVSGECSGVSVADADGNDVAYLLYWECAAEYKIEVDGEIIEMEHPDHLAMARAIAEEIADEIADNSEDCIDPEVYVVCPDGEKLRWDER